MILQKKKKKQHLQAKNPQIIVFNYLDEFCALLKWMPIKKKLIDELELTGIFSPIRNKTEWSAIKTRPWWQPMQQLFYRTLHMNNNKILGDDIRKHKGQ